MYGRPDLERHLCDFVCERLETTNNATAATTRKPSWSRHVVGNDRGPNLGLAARLRETMRKPMENNNLQRSPLIQHERTHSMHDKGGWPAASKSKMRGRPRKVNARFSEKGAKEIPIDHCLFCVGTVAIWDAMNRTKQIRTLEWNSIGKRRSQLVARMCHKARRDGMLYCTQPSAIKYKIKKERMEACNEQMMHTQ